MSDQMSPAPAARPGTAQAPQATAQDTPTLVRRLRGEAVDPAAPASVWFMRQAGRSLPEYREAREGTGMLEACLMPELAAEITLQPVRRHRVDAGIFFSDIVVPAKIAGLAVEIVPGRGPVFDHPIRTVADIDALPPIDDSLEDSLEPIREAVRLVTAELGATPLIGFCGAPFTVASYMVEGGPSRDHLRTRALMREDPAAWDRLAAWVAELSGRFLRAQVTAGAQAVQLFDSWVGALSAETYLFHVQRHSAAVLDAVADLDVPRIHFGVGASHLLREMHAAGATTMGVDHRIALDQAIDLLGGDVPVQGNIDPAVLFTGADARYAEADAVLARGASAPGHVVNLGHGVPPDTDPGVLTDLVAYLHEQSSAACEPSSTGQAPSTLSTREADAL
ncbi:uroporphyrinogen decarboxylase [Brachybacterium halotolerans]|uniref:uroporphyrinogen decarboxylase n=1 Tax=Brachybacterium halotolerans TaxID=2795215 RepID=UPI0038994A66